MEIDYPPDDLTLRARQWLADVKYPSLGEPFDARAAAVWVDGSGGFVGLWVQGFAAGETPEARYRAIQEEIERRIDAIVTGGQTTPSAPADARRPIAGRLELVDGGRGGLRDAHGPGLFCGCHAGDLLARFYRDRDTALRALDAIGGAGHQFVRTWTVLEGPWWAARTGEVHPGLPGYWTVVHEFARALVARGLRWQVSQGDMLRYYPGQAERKAFMRDLAQTLVEEGGADQLVVSVDAGNEAWQNGEEYEPTPASVARFAEVLQAFLTILPVSLSAMTSARDEGRLDSYAAVPASSIAYHGSRFHFRLAVERAWTAGYYDAKAWPFLLADEPVGVNHRDGDVPGGHVSATERPEDWRDDEAMGVYGVALLMTRQLPTWLSSPGVISDEPFEGYSSLGLWPRWAARLPQDLQTQAWTSFHGGEGRALSPRRIFAVPDDTVRCEHAMQLETGQTVALIYADAPGRFEIPIVNGAEGVLINPETFDETPVQLQAGQRWPVEFRRGRVFIGRATP